MTVVAARCTGCFSNTQKQTNNNRFVKEKCCIMRSRQDAEETKRRTHRHGGMHVRWLSFFFISSFFIYLSLLEQELGARDFLRCGSSLFTGVCRYLSPLGPKLTRMSSSPVNLCRAVSLRSASHCLRSHRSLRTLKALVRNTSS